MIIDAHVHLTDSGTWFATGLEATVDALLGALDEAGVDQAVVLPLAGYTTNGTIVRSVRRYSDRLIGFGTLGTDPTLESVRQVQELGLSGIKFHPRLERRTLTWLEQHGLLQEIEAVGLPLLVCGWLQSMSVPIMELTPLALDAVAKRHPTLTFILAHMGGHHLWDAVYCARSNENIYLDCSYAVSAYEGTSLAGDFGALLSRVDRKIIFGSDFPEVNIKEYLSSVSVLVEAAGLEPKREAIFSGNLLRVLGRAACGDEQHE